MWALKNGDLDEVKDYVAKVSRDAPGWGGRAREGAPGAGPARETAGWRRPGTLWLPVPGSRCVAKAAVAFLTPRGTRVLVVSVDPRGLFYPSRLPALPHFYNKLLHIVSFSGILFFNHNKPYNRAHQLSYRLIPAWWKTHLLPRILPSYPGYLKRNRTVGCSGCPVQPGA